MPRFGSLVLVHVVGVINLLLAPLWKASEHKRISHRLPHIVKCQASDLQESVTNLSLYKLVALLRSAHLLDGHPRGQHGDDKESRRNSFYAVLFTANKKIYRLGFCSEPSLGTTKPNTRGKLADAARMKEARAALVSPLRLAEFAGAHRAI